MMNTVSIYEIILFIYGFSLLFYIIDLMKAKWRTKRIATTLLVLAWIIQTGLIIYELFYLQQFPVLTLNEGIYIYGWLLLTISLVMNWIFPVRYIIFFVNVFAFSLFWLAITMHSDYQIFEAGIQLQHDVLIAHIALTIIAYGFLTLSFLLAVMYLIQHRLLKKKKGLRWMWRFADLSQLDRYSFSLVKLGVPLLFAGLQLGVIWAYISGQTFYWFDVKTIGSISVLAVYLVYLAMRWMRGYRGRSPSILNSATFLVLLVNFFLFNVWSNFHL